MHKPVVSVVMPVYNAAAYVADSIHSALGQTDIDLELIVADDGSTDGSLAAVADAAGGDSRVRIVPLAHCGMPGIVRNAGAREARGDVLAFLDADDAYLPGRLAASIDVLNRHDDVTAVFTDHYRSGERNPTNLGQPFLAQTQFVSRAKAALRLTSAGVYLTTPEYYAFMCLHGIPMCTDTVTIRRHRFLELGGFSETFRYNQDEDLWFRVAHAATIAYIDTPYARVWRRNDSHTGDYRSVTGRQRWEKFERNNIALHELNYSRGVDRLNPHDRDQYRELIAERWRDLAYTYFQTGGRRSQELNALAHAWRWHASTKVVAMAAKSLIPRRLRARYADERDGVGDASPVE